MTTFKVKKLDVYGKIDEPKNMVSNAYKVGNDQIYQPCMMYVSAVRNSGKSYSVSKMVRGLQREKVFDRVKIITPTFNSNKAYFGDLIKDIAEDVLEPTRDAVEKVIASVERERDEFEDHLEKLKEYNEFVKLLKKGEDFSDDMIMHYMDLGFLADNFKKPVFKYEKSAGVLRPPQTLLILDDCLSQPCMAQNSGLVKLATTGRHLGALQETFTGIKEFPRSALGLSVIIISQTYSAVGSCSAGRPIRENLTHLLLFKNKQEKQLEKIKDELASSVDSNKFDKAYDFATSEKFGNLLITFNSKCPTKTFRKNLNQLIIFDDDEKECRCG
tara:strand:- start:43 stop:1029 length:987 start_codon:yes stop_codon:yes gene_type:complete